MEKIVTAFNIESSKQVADQKKNTEKWLDWSVWSSSQGGNSKDWRVLLDWKEKCNKNKYIRVTARETWLTMTDTSQKLMWLLWGINFTKKGVIFPSFMSSNQCPQFFKYLCFSQREVTRLNIGIFKWNVIACGKQR